MPTMPGQMQLTRTLLAASSFAIAFASPTAAHFEAVYSATRGTPASPAPEDVTTIEPAPASIIAGATAEQVFQTPVTFTANVSCHCCGGISQNGPPGEQMPALATATST